MFGVREKDSMNGSDRVPTTADERNAVEVLIEQQNINGASSQK